MQPFQYTLQDLLLPVTILIAIITRQVSAQYGSQASHHDRNRRKSHSLRDYCKTKPKTKINSRHSTCYLQIDSMICPCTCRRYVVGSSRAAQQGHSCQPHARQDCRKISSRHALSCLKTIYTTFTCIHSAFLAARSLISRQKQLDRQLYSQQDRDEILPQRDEQQAVLRPFFFASIPLPMHWIDSPASYSMMEHQSHMALYHESAQANPYVPIIPSLAIITSKDQHHHSVLTDSLSSLLTLFTGDEIGQHSLGVAQVTNMQVRRHVEHTRSGSNTSFHPTLRTKTLALAVSFDPCHEAFVASPCRCFRHTVARAGWSGSRTTPTTPTTGPHDINATSNVCEPFTTVGHRPRKTL